MSSTELIKFRVIKISSRNKSINNFTDIVLVLLMFLNDTALNHVGHTHFRCVSFENNLGMWVIWIHKITLLWFFLDQSRFRYVLTLKFFCFSLIDNIQVLFVTNFESFSPTIFLYTGLFILLDVLQLSW